MMSPSERTFDGVFRQLLLLLAVIAFVSQLPSTRAQCNVCSVYNDLACVSETQFQVCVNGLTTGSAYACPTGYICSTSSATICQPNTNNPAITCSECNQCDATNTFACTGVRTFALCLGTGQMSSITGSCAPSHVCSIDFSYICGNATTGILPTCPTADDTTVAPTQSPSVQNPVTYCQTIQQRGRFPVGTDLSTTCKQYINCFLNNTVWSGALYTCPGSTYFNSSSQYCSPQVPARCLGTVSTLRLNSVTGQSFSLF